jgi:hypothetical protein
MILKKSLFFKTRLSKLAGKKNGAEFSAVFFSYTNHSAESTLSRNSLPALK